MTLEEAKIVMEAEAPEFARKLAPIYKSFQWIWGESSIPTEDGIGDELLCLIKFGDYPLASCMNPLLVQKRLMLWLH